MNIFIFGILCALGLHVLNTVEQKKRIYFLARYIGPYEIEKLMEHLSQGYMRALSETDIARRQQIWALLNQTENTLSGQFNAFANQFAQADALQARVCNLAVGFPFALQLFPNASFDLREAFKIHAAGIAQAIQNAAQKSSKDKAFLLSAELFLMQHTCHWFCKSKTTASARVMGRHQTSYEQVIQSVSPETRRAYLALTGSAPS